MLQNVRAVAGLCAALVAFAAWGSHPLPPKNPRQHQNGTIIAPGTILPSGTVVSLTADSDSSSCCSPPSYTLEFEVRLTSQAFTGTPTHTSPPLTKSSFVDTPYPDTNITLTDGSYKWQVREKTNSTGTWVQFNGGGTAFTIAPPNVPDILVDNVWLTNVVSDQANDTLSFVVNGAFKNRGTVNTGPFPWKAYLSTDKTLQVGTDTLLYTSSNTVDVPGTSTVNDASTVITLNPRPPPGAYYVLIEADPAAQGCTTNCGAVSEFDETNNVGSMPNYFINGVDLVASSISNGPANAGPGNTVTLNVNFFNQGVDSVAQPVEFRIVATRDQSVSADDYEVYRNAVTVGGNQVFNMPVTFTLPAGVAGGDVYWGLEVDPAQPNKPNPTVEALETNNTALSSAITHIQQADLSTDFADMVDLASGVSTRKADVGQPARFRIRTTNIGDFAAPSFHVGVILSKDSNLSLLSDYLFADVQVNGIAPGPQNTTTYDVTVTMPTKDREIGGSPLTTGDYYFFVMLDSYNAINELVESNNTMRVDGPVRLRTPAADYAVLKVTDPTQISAGEAFPITRTIKNAGTDNGAQTSYACYASKNDIIDVSDFPLSFVAANGTTTTSRLIQLDAGESDSATEWVRTSGSIPAGSYYVGCLVDPANDVSELEESNNAGRSSTPTQIAAQALQIVTRQVPDAVLQMPYSFRLSTVGELGPVTWSVNGMVAENVGLSSDGVLQGTPTKAGLTTFTVSATDGRSTAETVLTLRVLPPTTALAITTENLPPVVNSPQTPYQATFSAAGGVQPYAWRILSGALPNGIVLDAATGVLSGNPKPGVPNTETTLTVQVQDNVGSTVQKQIKIRTLPPGALTIVTLSLPDTLVNQDYIADLAATVANGAALSTPLQWSVIAGKLPEGLTLQTHTDQATGLLTGKATVAGTYPVTVQVQDANNRVDTMDYLIRVHASALRVTLAAPPPALIHPGDALDLSLVASGAGGAQFRLFAGGLPPGISLTEDGKISGTVAEEGSLGTWTFTVEAKDAAGGTGLGGFSVEVVERPKAQGCTTAGGVPGLLALFALAALLVFRRRAPAA